MMMNNMQMLMNMIKNCNNPQSVLMNMVQTQSRNNPVLGNILNMIQSGNTGGIESIARNICRERGIDPDQMFNQIRKY